MIFDYFCWVVSLALLLLVAALEGKGQEKLDILAERNEIPDDRYPKPKTTKTSGKPVLVIKEAEYEKKTDITDIQKELKTHSRSSSTTTTTTTERPKEAANAAHLVCPHRDIPKPFFALPCFVSSNCGILGKDMLCCEGRCVKGVVPVPNPHHEPIFFGIIQPNCPIDPLTELSEVKECITDEECSPRICCGETLPSGKKVRYCRTPIPEWETLPLPSPVLEPLKFITSYMQCTPPPPPHLDLYPKVCQNPIDCFPNLCCQENGKKFCRPPKRSILTLVAEVGQKIIPEDTARKFIERIS